MQVPATVFLDPAMLNMNPASWAMVCWKAFDHCLAQTLDIPKHLSINPITPKPLSPSPKPSQSLTLKLKPLKP